MPPTRAALFQPFCSGALSLQTRIALSPMGRAMSPGGVPPVEGYAAYYRRRVEAGVGLILTEATAIMHPAGGFGDIMPMIGGAAEPAWTQIVAAVHRAGGKIIPQLWHTGMHRLPGYGGIAPMGPSGLFLPFQPSPEIPPVEPTPTITPMSESDIADVIASFGEAAAIAQRIGFDGAEIHGGHGFLVDQFLWAHTNRRTDGWGGSLGNRLRFAIEVVRESRRRVGPDFPLLIRLSQFKIADYAARLADTPAEWERIVVPLAEAGIDIFDCSQRRFWEPAFAGSPLNLAGWTRKVTGRPVITCGSVGMAKQFVEMDQGTKTDMNLGNLPLISAMLEREEVDLVSIGRPLLADPEWPAKIRAGRDAEIVPHTPDAMARLV
jgi:2,4-dienoyl-CoA reductase-like NADH-dependent reductase (Old Yellow Enzyme family)